MKTSLFTLALLCVLVIACSFGRRAEVQKSSPQTPAATSMEDEAKKEFVKYLDRYTTPCGPSRVVEKTNGMDGNGIFEYRNPSITVIRVERVSEADKLNGVEWYALLDMNYSGYRRYFEGQWTEWQNNPRTAEWNFQVVKRTNGWTVDDHLKPDPQFSNQKVYSKIDCSRIPS
jgi:hypothetical protein